MTKHSTPKEWPQEIERTPLAVFWRAADGRYFTTSPTTILPPPVGCGEFATLDDAKRNIKSTSS